MGMSRRQPVLLILVACTAGAWSQTCDKYTRQVLLVSMDGFRYDYPEKVDTPHFDRMAGNGVKAAYVDPTFITKTFPTHYSIVTGLYDESHGIIGNQMYDPEFDEFFGMTSHETKWWDEGEPVWITARKENLGAGTVFWPGSETEIQGLRPDKWYTYNGSISFEQRVDMAIEMLLNDKFNFVTLYFHEPDSTGHIYGPDSAEVMNSIQEMDRILGILLDELNANGLGSSVNLILTSDHGMTAVDHDTKLVGIYDLVSEAMVEKTVEGGAVMHVLPVSGQEDAVLDAINSHPNLTAYRKADIPDDWHYKNNRRVMPIFVLADEGWTISSNVSASKLKPSKGNHGYDNRLMSMKPIFYAMGPNFKKGYSASSLRSIDMYNLMCELLQITPSPNNGTLSSEIQNFLNPYPSGAGCDGTNESNKMADGGFNVFFRSFMLVLGRFLKS